MTPADAQITAAGLQPWLQFFRSRRDRVLDLPWAGAPPLGPEARERISDSIATFQLGESSDGAHLLAAARAFGEAEALPCLEEITRCFVREEQFHASLLAAFMDANGIARKRSSWSDAVFRSLRRVGGFEATISVLVVAELIALTYYRALGAATPSQVLRRICELIVADELSHVAYEGMLIGRLRRRRCAAARWAALGMHSMLYAGAVVVVFLGHRRVLEAGGYRLPRFWSSCWASFAACVGLEPSGAAQRESACEGAASAGQELPTEESRASASAPGR